MGRAQHKRGIVKRVLGQERERLRLNLEDFLAFEFADADVVGAQQVVFGVVLFERKGVLIMEGFI